MPAYGSRSVFIVLAGVLVMTSFAPLRVPASEGRRGTYSVGMAERDISPERRTVVIGPAPSPWHEERYGDLRVTATAIRDERGETILILAADILHFEAEQTRRYKAAILERRGIAAKNILINASHNHSGPPLTMTMVDSPEKLDADYVQRFERQLLGAADDALASLRPSRLVIASDECDIAINRRVRVNGTTTMKPNPDGPVDHDVDVIRIHDAESDELRGVVVKYACHPVTMSIIGVGASYPGFMTEALQAERPGLHVQFLQGCSGDCRPVLVNEDLSAFIPGTLELCRSFGERLAAAVGRAAEKTGLWIDGPIAAELAEIRLPLRPADRAEFEEQAESRAWHLRRWGRENLARLEAGRPFDDYAPYAIQVIQLGHGSLDHASCRIVALDGEVFSGYSYMIRERLFPWATIVIGYSNAMTGYIPTAEEIPKGGYEVGAYRVWGTPGPFLPEIEERIVKTSTDLARILMRRHP